MRFFSDKKRPVSDGPYPLEFLKRSRQTPDLSVIPEDAALELRNADNPLSITNAMADYQAMLDTVRIGHSHKVKSGCPEDPIERTRHLKGFGYFNDASMVGVCELDERCLLTTPIKNPDIEALREMLRTRQTKTFSSGIDVIMADLRESMDAQPGPLTEHTHAIVFLYEYPRDPEADEPGHEWIGDAQAARASLRAAETAAVIGQYLRLYGYEARAHTATARDVDLRKLAVASGLAGWEDGELYNPLLSNGFGLAAITTDFTLAVTDTDRPLLPKARQSLSLAEKTAWNTGFGFRKNRLNQLGFRKRQYVNGAWPFEKLKRVDQPTTYIDEENVPRVPKRTDMFARALFGDLGTSVQQCAVNGNYVRKAGTSMSQRRALGAFIFLQDGEWADTPHPSTTDPVRNSENIKATAYFLGCDAVGMSRCPEWAWYSHNALGEPVDPPHDQAVSIIIDQGYETMEGASGDDWISCAQSMRAYLRFSLLGGVIANHIRALGYSAKAHTVVDGDVLQPPLLLLSGMGEVSRIGEVILNPYLGPRLKSGVITTTMPLAHDKPIDFGMQNFCEHCNKCARECPSGAITAGPKLMFNGYEIWKSDSQRCTSYRLSTAGGAMCGRCMKTCPWNLEGLMTEAPVRWTAMHIPKLAGPLAKLDDLANNGSLNPIKKWWWDLEMQADGSYQPSEHPVNERGLQKDLKLEYSEQTLAVYPAPLAPHPWPYPFTMDREKGIQAYQSMVSAEVHQQKRRQGALDDIAHRYEIDGDAPVIPVVLSEVNHMSDDVSHYVFKREDGSPLPDWTAGAHIDIVVAPEFLRQYSMCGNPADNTCYEIAVLREDEGRGGSKLMHRIFNEKRRVFISHPINHFPLDESASHSLFMGGGIGVTPMIAMAHRAQAIGQSFRLHYSISSRDQAGFLDLLDQVPWRDNVVIHVSDEGTRADLEKVIGDYSADRHVYTCGPDNYMNAVVEAAQSQGYPEEATHLEYFSVPEVPEYENHPFKLKLASGKVLDVPVDKTAADVLNDNGIKVDVKCSDGLCGVCHCNYTSGTVQHRDFVLSAAQRENTLILCQSRADSENETIELAIG